MLHTEPIVLPPYDMHAEPLGPRDRDFLDADAIIGFAQRSWRLCLIWIGVGLCASIAFLIVSPAYYTAYSTILFYDSTSKPAAASGTAADAVASAHVDTQIQVLQSDEVLGRVVDQNRLVQDRGFGIGMASTNPEARHATILRVVAALSVQRIGISDAVQIGFTSKSRLRSAAITNAIIQNYIDMRLELQRANTLSTPESSFLGVRVITPATPPVERSWPRTIFVFGIAVAAAVALGVAHALLREATDRSLRTAEDVRRFTGLDCITPVPKIEGQAWVIGEIHSGGLQPTYLNAAADFCQSMVRLAVRLQNRSKFVTGVVAPTAGAGASSVAAHLANILAESGRKTLLVDANWRKPTMGLSMSKSSPSRMLARRLAATHLEAGRLDVLMLRAAAPISPLNASLSIVTALQHLQPEYDCVVVDFHSTDQTADLEANIAVINDAVVVVEAERTTAESLRGLLGVLPRDKIEAVIVNKMASGPRELRVEFGRFAEPFVRCFHTALPRASLLLMRLAAWQTEVSHWAKLFGCWLCRTAWSGRRQLR